MPAHKVFLFHGDVLLQKTADSVTERETEMNGARAVFMVCLCLTMAAVGCKSSGPQNEIVVQQFPLDGEDQTITTAGVIFDREFSSDGKGSMKITAEGPTVVELFETGDIDLEDVRLIYQARVKTLDVEGQVYLEMYCRFPETGSFFSRGLQTPLSGTTDWTTLVTPFVLKKGENPDQVKLNLVFTGKGTAWIDAIRLLAAPL